MHKLKKNLLNIRCSDIFDKNVIFDILVSYFIPDK